MLVWKLRAKMLQLLTGSRESEMFIANSYKTPEPYSKIPDYEKKRSDVKKVNKGWKITREFINSLKLT